MKLLQVSVILYLLAVVLSGCERSVDLYSMSGTMKPWHPITIDFIGVASSEDASDNPFLNYRLDVTFYKNGERYIVPGYYAGDGDAAETSADYGNIWQVKFTPPSAGKWHFEASFKKGDNIVIKGDEMEGVPVAFDGVNGTFHIDVADGDDPGFYKKGKIVYNAGRYLQHAGSKEYFLKGGCGSPENFLAFAEIDGTERYNAGIIREGEAATIEELHHYEPHEKDWNEGDPLWQQVKGKNIIGGLNYLAEEEVNSLYFLSMNIDGDGDDVWPYTDHDERLRFDCSKLAQWEIIFSHMDKLGILLHIVLQETENETMLDGGDTGVERKLYLREMIARFGHHLGVIWNMGEENGPVPWSPDGQSTGQQKAMLEYIKEVDPYQNLCVIHSHADPKPRHEMFDRLLGDRHLDGMSMQIDKRYTAHEETLSWIEKSKKSGKQWVVSIDEIGHYSRGVDPDDRDNNNQDSVRREVLWGNLMAGGAGLEWYFGSLNHNNDLLCEDFRSRDRMWDHTRHAIRFFKNHLPFWKMESADHLVSGQDNWCFANVGEVYAVYLPKGGHTTLDLAGGSGVLDVTWYNPRSGTFHKEENQRSVSAGTKVPLGLPPIDPDMDWAILVKRQ